MESKQFIHKALLSFQSDVEDLQDELSKLISDTYTSDFKTKNGLITQSVYNINLQNKIDDVFKVFMLKYQNSVMENFANSLLKLSDINADYFIELGFDKTLIKNIQKQTNFIQKSIGLVDNKIVPGGYFDRISAGIEVRDQLKNYVLRSVNGKKDLKEFQKGFKNLIVGSSDKQNGLLQRYHRQYTYDTLSQVDRAENSFMADQLDLRFFVYEGGLIDDSREFCINKDGELFHVSEAEEWRNDPNLIDSATSDAYIPLIELGRYNCRHRLRYVTDEMAEELNPDKYEMFKDVPA